MVVYLEDPVTVSYHRLGDRDILIMGERHFESDGCKQKPIRATTTILPLKEFIQMWCKRIRREYDKNAQIDLFTESFYASKKSFSVLQWLDLMYMHKKTTPLWTFGLGYIRNHLDACSPKYRSIFGRFLLRCPEGLRIHLCDIRLFWQLPSPKKIPISVHSFFQLSEPTVAPDQVVERFGYYRRFFSSPVFANQIFRRIRRYLKIDKQIRAIPNKKQRETLQKWGVQEWTSQLRKARRKFFTMIRGESFNDDQWQDFEEAMIDARVVLMDMYLMGRMLRRFSDGSECRHIMVYVGEFHAHHYRQILLRMHATTLFESIPLHKCRRDLYWTSLPPCVNITRLVTGKKK